MPSSRRSLRSSGPSISETIYSTTVAAVSTLKVSLKSIAAKNHVRVELNSHMFNLTDYIYNLDFLLTFRRGWNNLPIYKGAAVLIFSHFMFGSCKQELNYIFNGDLDTNDSINAHTGSLHSNKEVSSHILDTYADESTKLFTTDDAITSFR